MARRRSFTSQLYRAARMSNKHQCDRERQSSPRGAPGQERHARPRAGPRRALALALEVAPADGMRLGLAAKRVALVAAMTAAAFGTGAAAAGQPTELSVYEPFSASGTPTVRVTNTVRGHCWTGSLAAAREDAWRCMSGNLIYDPCFSSASARGIVLCPATGAWSSAAIEIRLTQSLP